jgi:ubiquinone/menaquinone biosynthesis C-methylase UbiE
VKRDTIISHLEKMLKMGLFIDPLLVNTIWRCAEPQVKESIAQIVDSLLARFSLEQISREMEDFPYTDSLGRICMHSTVVSTACLISHEMTGSVYPSKAEVIVARERIEQFLNQFGIGSLYKVCYVIVGHDVMQPLVAHKNILEAEYVQGIWHYPYEPSQLELFLLVGLARNTFRLKITSEGRIIQLTKFGQGRYTLFDEILKEVKFMDKRISMSYVYQFDNIRDFDELCDKVWPDAHDLRRSFVQFAGISQSESVLEVGCGTGVLTYEAGLLETIGESGKLTAIDVSHGMLEQAKRKQQKYNLNRKIEFERASVENLPFQNEVFSASIGSAFLHFTNAPRAISEMTRVVVPGGTVAILQGLNFGLDQPFFRDWFEPIFEIARKNNQEKPKTYLPLPNQLSKWFERVGLENVEIHRAYGTWQFDDPEAVVQHIIRGVSFFQHELIGLPWNDLKSIVNELIDRGRDVCRRYSLADRTILVPSVMIKGVRPTLPHLYRS